MNFIQFKYVLFFLIISSVLLNDAESRVIYSKVKTVTEKPAASGSILSVHKNCGKGYKLDRTNTCRKVYSGKFG